MTPDGGNFCVDFSRQTGLDDFMGVGLGKHKRKKAPADAPTTVAEKYAATRPEIFSPAAKAAAAATTSKPKMPGWVLPVAIGVGAVVLLGGVFFVVRRKKK